MKKLANITAIWITDISSLWVFVEFILYLSIDKAFNWWSVWITLAGIAFILSRRILTR